MTISSNREWKWLKRLSPNKYYLTAKQYRDAHKYVQNKAKNHPNKTTKENELIVFIVARGVNAEELVRLNIEDLPYYHGEPSIHIHNRRVSKNREVYLDESLETKINDFVKKYRQGAKPNDPLFASKDGIRSSWNSIYRKLNGKKQCKSRRRQIGINERLGIESLSPGVFKNTLVYQAVGLKSTDKNAEKKPPKSKARGITIPQFIRKYVEPNASENRVNSLHNILRKANGDELIKLPSHIGPWTSGQCKYYKEILLLINWNGYADKLNGRLPRLITTHIKISD